MCCMTCREVGHGARTSDQIASSSSKSDGSHTTSPVLSTTTLQTTPSPPNSDKDDGSACSPVVDNGSFCGINDETVSLRPSNMLHPIPYVPATMVHMPAYSQEAF